MFGGDAPASVWHMTFDHVNLGPASYFTPVPGNSPFNRQGNGQVVKQNKGNTGGGNGNRNRNGTGNDTRTGARVSLSESEN